MRERKARILYDKKNQAFYVFNKGEKVYLEKKPTNGNINIINKIINKLPEYKPDIRNKELEKRKARSGKVRGERKPKKKILSIPNKIRDGLVEGKKDIGITQKKGVKSRTVPKEKKREQTEQFNMVAPLNLYGKFKSYNELEKMGIKDASTLSLLGRFANPTTTIVGGTVPAILPPPPVPIQFQINPVMNPMAPFQIPIQPNIQPVMNPMAPFQIPIQPNIQPVMNPMAPFQIPIQPTITGVQQTAQTTTAPQIPPIEIKLVDDDDKTIDTQQTARTTTTPRARPKLPPNITGIGVPPPTGTRTVFNKPPEPSEEKSLIETLDLPLESIEEEEEEEETAEPRLETATVPIEEKKEKIPVSIPPPVQRENFDDLVNSIPKGRNKDLDSEDLSTQLATEITNNLKLEEGAPADKPIIVKYLRENREVGYRRYDTKGEFEKEIETALAKYGTRPISASERNNLGKISIGSMGKDIKNPRDVAVIKTLIPDASGEGIQIFDGKKIKRKARGAGYWKKIEKLVSTKGGYNTPLWDGELIDMLTPYRAFLGVVMRDEVKNILREADKRGIDRFGFVQNLDSSDMEGSHWVGWFIDLTGDKMICYYDPFGKKAQADVLEEIKNWTKKKVPYYLKFKSNRVSQQASKSNRCGFHVAKWLIHMFKTNDFKDATDWESITESENEAMKMEKNWKKFGYI